MDGKLVHQQPSIADVAREAGVSKATVSNWLNRRWTKVSLETRTQLEAVATRLGYHPMLGARRLASRVPSGTVGLLVRRDLGRAFADPYFAHVMEGVSSVFTPAGVRGLVVTSPSGTDEDTGYLLSLARGIVDGFLVFDLEDHDQTLEAFVRHGVRVVGVGQPEGNAAYPWVASDHAGAVTEAVRWLAQRGHRALALEDEGTTLLSRHRHRGFVEGLAATGSVASPSPTAVFRTREGHRRATPQGVEVVILDAFPHDGTPGARIEAPSVFIGERAATLLLQPEPQGHELYPARFVPGIPPT